MHAVRSRPQHVLCRVGVEAGPVKGVRGKNCKHLVYQVQDHLVLQYVRHLGLRRASRILWRNLDDVKFTASACLAVCAKSTGADIRNTSKQDGRRFRDAVEGEQHGLAVNDELLVPVLNTTSTIPG